MISWWSARHIFLRYTPRKPLSSPASFHYLASFTADTLLREEIRKHTRNPRLRSLQANYPEVRDLLPKVSLTQIASENTRYLSLSQNRQSELKASFPLVDLNSTVDSSKMEKKIVHEYKVKLDCSPSPSNWIAVFVAKINRPKVKSWLSLGRMAAILNFADFRGFSIGWFVNTLDEGQGEWLLL